MPLGNLAFAPCASAYQDTFFNGLCSITLSTPRHPRRRRRKRKGKYKDALAANSISSRSREHHASFFFSLSPACAAGFAVWQAHFGRSVRTTQRCLIFLLTGIRENLSRVPGKREQKNCADLALQFLDSPFQLHVFLGPY